MDENPGSPRDDRTSGDYEDPTLVRNQSALTTASGTEWLVVGALFALISCAVLLLLRDRGPAGLAFVLIGVIVGCLLAMIVVRAVIHRRRLRLGILASLLGAIALISLSGVLAIAATQLP